MIRPVKSLGQNFLKDENIIKKIINEINPLPNETVIEIGPGEGALTKHLIKSEAAFTAVEYDRRAVEHLQIEFPSLKIIQSDFLKFDLKSLSKDKLRIVGNIPYNITSPIIFKMLENRELINDSVMMIQYEVAKRITSKIGTKDYGILSVLLNTFAETKFCFKVSPNVFYPKPKVDSAVIHIYFNKKIDPDLNEELFIKLVKASFNNRRKTLKNSLSNSIFRVYDLNKIDFDFSKRAEQLTISEFINLAKIFDNLANE